MGLEHSPIAARVEAVKTEDLLRYDREYRSIRAAFGARLLKVELLQATMERNTGSESDDAGTSGAMHHPRLQDTPPTTPAHRCSDEFLP